VGFSAQAMEHAAWLWPALAKAKVDLVISDLTPADWDWNQTHCHHGTPLMAVSLELIRHAGSNEQSFQLLRYLMSRGADPRVMTRGHCTGQFGPWGGEGLFPKTESFALGGYSAITMAIQVQTVLRKFPVPYAAQIANVDKVLKIYAEYSAPESQLVVPQATVGFWEEVLRDKASADVDLEVPSSSSASREPTPDSGGVVKAHSLILKAASPVLKALLASPMKEGATGHIRVEGVGLPSVRTLLQLLYTGVLEDEEDVNILLGVLDLAHRWQIPHVVRLAEGALVPLVELETLGVLCETALLKNLSRLRASCQRFAAWKSKSKDFLNLLKKEDFPEIARNELCVPETASKKRRRK